MKQMYLGKLRIDYTTNGTDLFDNKGKKVELKEYRVNGKSRFIFSIVINKKVITIDHKRLQKIYDRPTLDGFVEFDTDYYINNKGVVYSLKYDQYIKPQLIGGNKTKYYAISVGGIFKYVHRLVYKSFGGSIPEGYEINHIDMNKLNNDINNLECITKEENMKKMWAIKRVSIRATMNGQKKNKK